MIRLLFLLTVYFMGLSGKAQDLAKEIDVFNLQISGHDKKIILASIWVLDSKVSQKEELAGEMELVQSGSNCFYKFLDVEVIQNDKLMLQIDHLEKTIQAYKPTNSKDVLAQYSPDAVKQFTAQADTIKRIDSHVGNNGYRLEYGKVEDGLEAIEMFFDKTTGQLKETRYLYNFYDWVTNDRSSYRLRIRYESYQFPQTLPANKFGTANIIEYDGKSFLLKGIYKSYTLWLADELKNKP